jgi:DNA-binding response OmpR family regulator
LTCRVCGSKLPRGFPAQWRWTDRRRAMLSSAVKSKLAKRSFLVADKRELLSLMVPYLQDMGVRKILRATDGRAAIDMLNNPQYHVDMIICDWALPNLSGLDVLKYVRKKFGKTPFLMLSARVTRESIAAAAEHGVNGYLAKPFTVQLLEKRVVALLQALPWDESHVAHGRRFRGRFLGDLRVRRKAAARLRE